MVKLNVIDLDDTLLPYDSLNEYIRCFLGKPRQLLPLMFILALRKLRLIDRSSFLKFTMIICRKARDYDSIMRSLAANCCSNLDKEILSLVHTWTDNSTIVVLCTASPYDYTKYISDYLGWQLLTSEFSCSGFVHMYAENKTRYINQKYPPSLYEYNFAISDSTRDRALLMQFNNYAIKTKKAGTGN